MGAYINKSTIVAAAATMAGMFLYKQFVSNKVNQVLAGGAK